MEKIYYVKPSITNLEIEYATKSAIDGWGDRSNYYIDEFETAFASKLGSGFATATSSCTGALHLGLVAIGLKPDDEVILADTNWIATVAPILYVGAKPVLVDIDESTWCLDVNEVRRHINSKTKAIIATHIYGNLCEMAELKKLADEFDIFLIEDAAEAIGSYYHGQHAGTLGHFGVFSFHGSKTMTTGEGGMLVSENEDLVSKVRSLNSHGREINESRQFWPSFLGYKYRMSNIQAAIGIAQLSRFDELVNRKREILNFYRDKLQDTHEISINPLQENCTSGAWMPNAVFTAESKVTREKLIDAFTKANIDARVFFWPLSSLDFLDQSSSSSTSASIASRSINLPSYHDMTTRQLDRVIDVLISQVS